MGDKIQSSSWLLKKQVFGNYPIILSNIKILIIISASSQIIKAAILCRTIKDCYSSKVEEVLIHTGQNYDENMSAVLFKEMDIPKLKYNLLSQAFRLNLSNCTFLDFVPKTEINKYISVLDIALVNLKKSNTFRSVIPSKIFENAAMQKPILLGVEGESEKIIKRYKAGECFEPENKEEFIRKLQILHDEISNGNKKYKEGMTLLAQNFDRKKLAIQMLSFIKQQVN